MNDNDILFAFQKGMPLLRADNVEHKDSEKILKALEQCAYELFPIIHKYDNSAKSRQCKNCVYGSKKENKCLKFSLSECYCTSNRPFYK